MSCYMVDKEHIIARWLYLCAGLVIVMAVIGAVTRLTNSGLSMVEWRPLLGALPPVSESEWERVFQLYKQSSEYRIEHYWMGLSDFKIIFFWEWFHRFFGRVIGLVFSVPFIIFLIKGWFTRDRALGLLAVLILGAAQGVMGWFMVMSGLSDRADVSHFRLAAHLMLAVALFMALIWQAGIIHYHIKKDGGLAVLALVLITMLWGAFVAGLDAGLVYNTFPMMNNSFLPEGHFAPLTDHGWVQFMHRWLAIFTALIVLVYWWCMARHAWVIAALVVVQVVLGITTLLLQVPLWSAALHQMTAFLLVGSIVITLRVPRSSP